MEASRNQFQEIVIVGAKRAVEEREMAEAHRRCQQGRIDQHLPIGAPAARHRPDRSVQPGGTTAEEKRDQHEIPGRHFHHGTGADEEQDQDGRHARAGTTTMGEVTRRGRDCGRRPCQAPPSR